jgi:hypothetical protein
MKPYLKITKQKDWECGSSDGVHAYQVQVQMPELNIYMEKLHFERIGEEFINANFLKKMVQEKGGWGLESGSQKGTFLQFT